MSTGDIDGSYFVDDENMWWFNGWYKGKGKLNAGYKWTSGSTITSTSNSVNNILVHING
jgi:hypothetical protein